MPTTVDKLVLVTLLTLSHICVLCLCNAGKSATAAATSSLQYMGERVKGCGGAIVLSSTGDWAADFTTPRMAWASIKEDVLHWGLNPKEEFTEMLKC